MKARLYPIVLSLVFALLAVTAGRAEPAAAAHPFVDPEDPRVARIRTLGEHTIDQVGNAMILEVRNVLSQTSPALAIGALHLKNYELPPPAPGQPAITALKRTSLKVRNPANSPDAADLAALELINEQLENGDEVSKVLVQHVSLPGQPPEWRVYRPLAVLKQCMDCHGSERSLAPGVADTLKVFYPADQAVGYRSGQWRGLIRVSITASPEAK